MDELLKWGEGGGVITIFQGSNHKKVEFPRDGFSFNFSRGYKHLMVKHINSDKVCPPCVWLKKCALMLFALPARFRSKIYWI